jgi:predicted RNA binding protein YcfA (HicA-like mRNA interferase family)
MPSEVRFGEVRKLLESKGYVLHRITGSHHIFVKAGAAPVSVPVHHGKVKPNYVRKIQKIQ